MKTVSAVNIASVWICSKNQQPPDRGYVERRRKEQEQAVDFVEILECFEENRACGVAGTQVVELGGLPVYVGAHLAAADWTAALRDVAMAAAD
jgi:hypothetical protein